MVLVGLWRSSNDGKYRARVMPKCRWPSGSRSSCRRMSRAVDRSGQKLAWTRPAGRDREGTPAGTDLSGWRQPELIPPTLDLVTESLDVLRGEPEACDRQTVEPTELCGQYVPVKPAILLRG